METEKKHVATPSMTKIHRQPSSPPRPSRFSMAYASNPENMGPSMAKLKKQANLGAASPFV